MYACRRRGRADGLTPERDLPGHGGNAMGCPFRDPLYRFGDFPTAVRSIEGAFFFHVEVLGVFAHDDEVNGGGGGGDGFHGAHIGVEVELLAEGDDGGGVSGNFFRRGRDGAEEGGGAFRV